MKLILYSTQGCHLCEQAYELYISSGREMQLDIVDIAFDDTLFSRYGVTIPVISYSHNEDEHPCELGWPFDQEQLEKWLDINGIN